MFGSLGWGLAMFFVGIALDHSTAFSSHPCGGPQRFEKNYTICFATFSVLMGAALITATQVRSARFPFSQKVLFYFCIWVLIVAMFLSASKWSMEYVNLTGVNYVVYGTKSKRERDWGSSSET